MYSNKENVLYIIALMLKSGITDVVVCPGARNAALAHSFSEHKAFACYPVTDERSAGFFALGLAQRLEKPVAVCCTSGSALLNVAPAVSEAFYQQIPLLVLSADRPTAWIGQMDGQTLHQPGIFGNLAKLSVQLPEPKSEEERWLCRRLINEALLELTHRSLGPVHINVPLSEPLFDFCEDEIPDIPYISRVYTPLLRYSDFLDIWKNALRPIIIVGQQPYNAKTAQLLATITEKQSCIVLAEHLANLPKHPFFIGNFDAMLAADADNEDLFPDMVIYLGGHIVSKRLKKFIRHIRPAHCWFANTQGNITDLFQCQTAVIEGNTNDILSDFLLSSCSTEMAQKRGDFQKSWTNESQYIRERADSFNEWQFSDLSVWKSFARQLPPRSVVQLANSSTVRNAQLFDFQENTQVFCNRGTSGIEGSLSTTVGYAVMNQGLTFIVIGDLSFFYDMNALWNQNISPKLRILLINNGEGEIFRLLPQLEPTDTDRKFVGAQHQTSAKGWAESVHFTYLAAHNQEELDTALPIFVKESEQPVLLEVTTQAKTSEEVFKAYYNHLEIQSIL